VILPGNASHLVKNCFKHRINWKECQSNVTTMFNFKWQQNIIGIDYYSLSKTPSVKQIFNHFEFHQQISNKFNLFINMTKYCEENDLEVFNFLPFTVIMQYDCENYHQQMISFTNFYDNISEYLVDLSINSDIDRLRKNTSKNTCNLNHYSLNFKKKYIHFFNFNGMGTDKLGKNTTVFIPTTHYISRNLWLVKAANLNRGRCIKIADSLQGIQKLIKKFYDGINKKVEEDEETEIINPNNSNNLLIYNSNKNKSPSNCLSNDEKEKKKNSMAQIKYRSNSILIQKYIENPLLYNGRKFDVRVWVLVTHKLEVYVFKEGHLKTSSSKYDINNINKQIHLTNYSVQKYCDNFSKFEEGNEVPFKDFQLYLDNEYGKEIINVKKDIFKKIKKLIEISCRSVQNKINLNSRNYCFEIFGYDFMIDANFNIFLLEVNTNPGLEESSSWIKVIVPRMLDDAMRLTIDELFETKFNFCILDEKEKVSNYCSPFPVDGYKDSDILWEFICNLNEDSKIQKKDKKLKIKKKTSKKISTRKDNQ